MISKISLAIKALRTGSALTDPSVWKVRQNAVNAIYAFLGVVAAALPILGISLEISNEDIMLIAGGVATIGGLFNNYFTTATTTKIGLPSKSKNRTEESENEPGKGHFDWRYRHYIYFFKM